MEKLANIFSEFFRVATTRKVILIFSIILSVGLYKYISNHLFADKEDFLAILWDKLISKNESFNLFSGDVTGGEYSLYFQLGNEAKKAASKNNMIIKLEGSNNSALNNAFGVVNNTNSFGIVQSDTYLKAPFLNNSTKIKNICALYMERLHILVKCPKTNNKVLFQGHLFLGDDMDFYGNQVLKQALADSAIMTGGPYSSAREYLSYLLKESNIDYTKHSNNIRYGSYSEIFEYIENVELNSAKKYAIAVFTLGTHNKVNQLLQDPQYKLMAIDPAIIPLINNRYNQKLETTYFDGIYNYQKGLSTIGIYANLVASADVTDLEIVKFLRAMMSVSVNTKYQRIFENPPISLSEVENFYEYQNAKTSKTVIGSLMIFIISIIVTSSMITYFIMYFTSKWKKVKYYEKFIKDYNEIIDRNNANKVAEAKISTLSDGIKNLEGILYDVRNDFESGGMTSSDHEYLIENFNTIYEFYRERLARRMYDKILECFKEMSQESKKVAAKNIKKEINDFYSQDKLTRDSYKFLIEALNCETCEEKKSLISRLQQVVLS